MQTRFAYVDRSLESFVISCEICEGWACVRLTVAAAQSAKADHDVLVHGVSVDDARDALKHHRLRHAARSRRS